MTSKTDPFGRTTTYTYDLVSDKIVEIAHPDGTVTKTEHDAAGRVVAETGRMGRMGSHLELRNCRPRINSRCDPIHSLLHS